MVFHFKRLSYWLAVLLVPLRALAADQATSVTSPDGSVQVKVSFKGGIAWEVLFKNSPVIEPSRLVFSLDGVEVTAGPETGVIQTYRINETYPWRGLHSQAVNQCNGATVPLKYRDATYTLELRAFNDGVAYRFIVPGWGKTRVPDEASTFVLPAGSKVWYHDFNGHYEGVHTNTTVGGVPVDQWIATPMTFKLPDGHGYASITEADLVNYSGMGLHADGRRTFSIGLAHKQPPSHPFVLRYSTNDVTRLSKPAAISGAFTTPWRVVLVAASLNALVNSDIVPNLCPAPDPRYFPQGMKTAWVKPGRAVWKYLDGGTNTLEGTKEFCKLAGALGFEYNVIEGYWGRWSDAEIKDLVSYAREQGVKLFVWKHSRALRTPQEREDFFKRLHDLGVAGAKIDFFDHEHKEMVDLYETLLETAARHQVLLNFHGANKPTGTIRTWPNELTREGVKGMESRRVPDRATHDATLPFTRFLAGPGDYTPMHFGERRANTTWPHQVATAAMFQMPLLTYAANPTAILTNPAVELITSIPATWDETIVLPPSEISQVAVFAQRSGETWFLSVLNSAEARTIHVPLSFLGPGDYAALLVRDAGSGPDAELIEHRAAHQPESLTINLRPGGGFIGRFKKD